jgi:hypothetical protein
VAGLIDLYVDLRNTVPDKSANGNDAEREDHLQRWSAVEGVLNDALAYYGVVVWRGRCWFSRVPVRLYAVNWVAFGGFGDSLPWPPGRKEPVAEPPQAEAPAVEEKIGGFISTDKFCQ